MNSPKVSIVIPVHNVEQYLNQCIDSVVNQTLRDIEIICVNNDSNDNSLNILKEYQEKDGRVKVTSFEECVGPLTARKIGVDQASGEYIMFVDSDDYLELNACELVLKKIEEMQVDILQFSTFVHNCANIDENKVKNLNDKRLVPYDTLLKDEEVFKAAVIDNKYSFTLWNKIYKAQLCKQAFADIQAKYLPVGEDLFIYFAIAYYAKSYYGWKSPTIYNYCFGRGVTGSDEFTLNKFERHCYQAEAVAEMDNFCKSKDYKIPGCAEFLKKYKENWCTACVIAWKEHLPKEFAAEGLEMLYKHWDPKDIVLNFIERYGNKKEEIAKKIGRMPSVQIKDKTIKTVALYYSRYSVGGTEKVMSLLMPIFVEMGYNVVLITEEQPSDNDFPLPNKVKRVILAKENSSGFADRLNSLQKITEENNIDIVLYNAWGSNRLIWDLLYLKGKGVSVISQAHSVFSYRLLSFDPRFFRLTSVYALLDGVVVLSQVDKLFWEVFNKNTYYIPNPVSKELFDVENVRWSNKAIIWIGRTTYEKNPQAPFEIMRLVAAQIPDAKMYLLGDFDDPKWKETAQKYSLENNIVFTGFVSDVNKYIAQSSVHLMTSSFEGFPMSLLEAKAHGMPTVMFDMPHLELGSTEKGTIGVDMMDCAMAADEIVKLLQNEEYWNKISANAQNCASEFKNYDYKEAWNDVFAGKEPQKAGDSLTEDLVNTIVNHYELGYIYTNKSKKSSGKSLSQNISAAIKCAKEKGVVYTVKLFFKKIV
ncbi:MAG: glycosyltransferase [Ruminococcaceae bacterium]|nr:glycosyltransferase [Oscillospiraceae bacterium]